MFIFFEYIVSEYVLFKLNLLVICIIIIIIHASCFYII